MLHRQLLLCRSSMDHSAQVTHQLIAAHMLGPHQHAVTPAAEQLLQCVTGKSKLLVAMLHLMAHHMRSKYMEPGQPKRVLLAAHTNIAVDRVLLGLLDSGCTGELAATPQVSGPYHPPTVSSPLADSLWCLAADTWCPRAPGVCGTVRCAVAPLAC